MTGLTEELIRKELIDPALKRAGWDVENPDQVGIEIPADEIDEVAWHKLQKKLKEKGAGWNIETPAGICDYGLYSENGQIVAVVEAKKTSVNPALAQAEFYVKELEKLQGFRPFGFMTNGYEIQFWDVGEAINRLVHGFFTPQNLENVRYIREHRTPLTEITINPSITDRLYQQEAIGRGNPRVGSNPARPIL